MKIRGWMILFVVLLIAGCTPKPQPMASESHLAASPVFAPISSATSKLSPSSTPTPSQTANQVQSGQRATAAAALTQAALTRATLTAAAIASSGSATASAPTLTPTPTPELGEILPELEAARGPEDVWTSTSPDGRWLVEGINQICAQIKDGSFLYYRLGVSRQDGSGDWVILEDFSECGVGYPIYEPVGWSADSRYFYYAERLVPDGCPAFYPGRVYRVNAANQNLTYVDVAVDWSLSPDHTRLALTSEKAILLLDTIDGETTRVAIHAPQALLSGLVWSPDSDALIVTALEHSCGYISTASIVRLDLPDLTQGILVESGNYTTVLGFNLTSEWQPSGQVLVHDLNGGNWWLDTETGEVTPKP